MATQSPGSARIVPWREKYLVYGAPFVGEEEVRELHACVDSAWLGSGPRVARFQNDFAEYVTSPHAIGVNSCTAALHLSLRVLDLPPGSEVITTPMTFCATANAIIHAGLKPVFADCDPRTMNLDVKAIRAAITRKTRAIVPVHFAGLPCDMPAIMALAKEHGLKVVEDCAHAVESTIDGRHCGTFGDLGCFSFYVTKNVMTVEGGMIICKDPALADRLKVMALHGMSKDAWKRFSDQGFVHYDVVEPGFKYNLTDIAASFGIHQLARVESMWPRRQQLWDYYMKELADLPLILPTRWPAAVRPALHLFACLIDPTRTDITRDQVLTRLHELKIGAGVHYRAVHLFDYYRRTYGYKPGAFPNAESIGDRTFSIPLSGAVSDEDAADVVRALRIALDR
jgi:dTDP-4-amino-4,6-dideoxygalactose transaminase